MMTDKIVKTVGFEFFDTNEQLRDWQMANPDFCVSSIVPVVQDSVSVMVTYIHSTPITPVTQKH